jgi:drug/metabolite transporter (DMT)-like permease
VYPLFVAIFGSMFFGERFRFGTIGSIVICTFGAFLVMRDGSGAALSGDILALASAVLAGVAINFVRKAIQFDNTFMLYLSPCLFGLPILAFVPLPAASVLANPVGIILLFVIGVGTFVGHALMAKGYRTVPAGRGSIVFYWETALTVLLGVLLAGERFNLRFGLGLILILAGLWLNRERKAPTTEPSAA